MRNYLDRTAVGSRRTSIERRNSPRYPLSAFAEIVEARSRSKMSARTSDISRTGSSPFYVVNEIVVALMREGILTHQEGKAMLQKLVH